MQKVSSSILLHLMKTEGESILVDDYFSGEFRTYAYNKHNNTFYINYVDTVVGSYNNTVNVSELDMLGTVQTLAEFDEWAVEYIKNMNLLLIQLKQNLLPKVNRPNSVTLNNGEKIVWDSQKQQFYVANAPQTENVVLETLCNFIIEPKISAQGFFDRQSLEHICRELSANPQKKLQYQPPMTPARFTLSYNNDKKNFELLTEDHLDLSTISNFFDRDAVMFEIVKFPIGLELI